MENTSTTTLTMTRRFEVTAEKVFDAWLNPEMMKKWFFTDFPERESPLLQRWDDSEVETGVSLDTLMFQLFCSLNERIL